jgi:hypothetical protein
MSGPDLPQQPSSFPADLQQLTVELPVLAVGNTRLEQRENTWSVTRATTDVATAEEIGRALRQIASAWLAHAQGQGGGTFYAWYDEQAGQLRMSMTSALPEALPFGAPVQQAASPTDIARLVLRDDSPGIIGWDELHDVEGDPVDVGTPPPLLMWCEHRS